MHRAGFNVTRLIETQPSDPDSLFLGGLFLHPNHTLPPNFLSLIPHSRSGRGLRKTVRFEGLRGGGGGRGLFLSVSFSINGTEGDGDEGYVRESGQVLGQNGIKKSTEEEEAAVVLDKKGSGAMNTTKHLWSGAVAAMVSRLPFYLTKPPHSIAKFHFWLSSICIFL